MFHWKLVTVVALIGVTVACTPVGANLREPTTGENPGVADADKDGVPDSADNCSDVANADQVDVDVDAVGDACDPLVDQDTDGVADAADNCLLVGNVDQVDGDTDGFGDVCDNCPGDGNADQADSDADGIGDACPCDACGAAQWCSVHPSSGATCLDDCPNERQGADQHCCPLGARADEQGNCPLPNLHVDLGRFEQSLCVDTKAFTAQSCEFIEGCVNGTGTRTLLRFDTTTPNDGAGHLHLGDPDAIDTFVFSPCHGHYHFESYAAYEVQDGAGNVVAPGHKQAFCLMDFEPWTGGWNTGEGYDCGYQGISSGWADTYYNGLDCQFVDITDVPDLNGTYTVQIHVNHDELIAEGDYSNNVLRASVDLSTVNRCN